MKSQRPPKIDEQDNSAVLPVALAPPIALVTIVDPAGAQGYSASSPI